MAAPKKPKAPAKGRDKAAPAKKPAAKKPAAKAKAGPARPKRATGKPVTSPVRKPRSWKWIVARELATVGVGISLGLAATGLLLWRRAKDDVQSYLASPPRAMPGVLYSAPMALEVGTPLSASELAGDLLSAGYERVDAVRERDQFSLVGEHFEIWTAPDARGNFKIPGGKLSVELQDGRVSKLSAKRALLRPTVLAVVGDLDGKRDPVFLERVSPHLPAAVIAMEDSRFRSHYGLDPVGVLRAVWHNLRSDGGVHGGSTLTQQLAKNLFLSSERTMQRKVREAFFAAALESKLSKDELLELYLGEVYLGQVGGVPLHGAEQASRAWFGVSTAQLSLAQSALMAGVISSPNAYSPTRHPERALERRRIALGRMVDVGAITQAEADAAAAEPLDLRGQLPGSVRRAPWAVDVAVDLADEIVGEGALATGGWQVFTTIQPATQRAAERAVREGVGRLGVEDAQAALTVVRVSDGAVLAVVGGRDYRTSPYNRATSAWRQAGSTVKPLTLVAAFDEDPALSPISPIEDAPLRVGDWSPTNYDGVFQGTLTLRQAIEQSRNLPAVRLAQQVGAAPLQHFYESVGLSRATALPSAALGSFPTTTWEMAGAYTIFPSGGRRAAPWLVDALVSPQGQVERPKHPVEDIVSARAAALATSVLEGVISDGTGRGAAAYDIRGSVGGKTGTTNDGRDAWFVGFSPELSIAVWVGRDRGEPLGMGGGKAALPIWASLVHDLGADVGDFPAPRSIEYETVCVDSHLRARAACPLTYKEVFSAGHAPKDKCEEHGGIKDAGFSIRDLFRRQDNE